MILHRHCDVMIYSIELQLTRLTLTSSLPQHLPMDIVQQFTSSLGPSLISKLIIHYILTFFLLHIKFSFPSSLNPDNLDLLLHISVVFQAYITESILNP